MVSGGSKLTYRMYKRTTLLRRMLTRMKMEKRRKVGMRLRLRIKRKNQKVRPSR